MAKIRHIAYRAVDVEAMANFFVNALDHIGFTVEDDGESSRLLESSGAKKIATLELGSAAHYEVKFKGPEGIVVDLGHWIGTAPIEGEQKLAARETAKGGSQ